MPSAGLALTSAAPHYTTLHPANCSCTPALFSAHRPSLSAAVPAALPTPIKNSAKRGEVVSSSFSTLAENSVSLLVGPFSFLFFSFFSPAQLSLRPQNQKPSSAPAHATAAKCKKLGGSAATPATPATAHHRTDNPLCLSSVLSARKQLYTRNTSV